MTALKAGPYIFSTSYLIDGLTHDLEFNCDTLGEAIPGMAAVDVDMAARSLGAAVSLQTAADEFWAAFRPLLPTTAQCSTYTLWRAGVNNTVRTFISGGVFTTPNGSAAGAYVPAQQLTMTFRSATGRIGRLICLETTQTGSAVYPLNPDGSSTFDVVAAYVVGENSIVCARDGSFFVQALNGSLGQNEKVFEKRYRS